MCVFSFFFAYFSVCVLVFAQKLVCICAAAPWPVTRQHSLVLYLQTQLSFQAHRRSFWLNYFIIFRKNSKKQQLLNCCNYAKSMPWFLCLFFAQHFLLLKIFIFFFSCHLPNFCFAAVKIHVAENLFLNSHFNFVNWMKMWIKVVLFIYRKKRRKFLDAFL